MWIMLFHVMSCYVDYVISCYVILSFIYILPVLIYVFIFYIYIYILCFFYFTITAAHAWLVAHWPVSPSSCMNYIYLFIYLFIDLFIYLVS